MGRKYDFVGGPYDGRQVEFDDTQKLGAERPMTILGQPNTSVYTFSDDGKFHFTRFGPPALAAPSDAGSSLMPDLNALHGILMQLGAPLNDLEAYYLRAGGFAPLQVGNWSVEYRPDKKPKQ